MIRVRSVTKTYGSARALQEVSLDIPAGAIFGLIGPNGAGKTTLLRLLAGLVAPTSGSIVFESDAAGQPPAGGVGYLPQRVSFNGLATPLEILRLFTSIRNLPPDSAARALATAGIEDVASREVRTLSGGMRQRLGLAVACLGNPQVLLLDEPDAGLDPRAAIELRQRVRQLAAQGRTIVFSSHSLPELETICDWLAILANGQVVRQGSVASLKGMAAEQSLERLFLEATT